MHPGFMVKRMVADLVTSISNGSEYCVIFFKCRILAHDKESDGQISGFEKVQDARH